MGKKALIGARPITGKQARASCVAHIHRKFQPAAILLAFLLAGCADLRPAEPPVLKGDMIGALRTVKSAHKDVVFDIARQNSFPVVETILWETPNCYATYRG